MKHFAVVALMMLLSCNTTEEQPTDSFFNLRRYFTGHIRMLKAQNAELNKTVFSEGDTSSRRIANPDWNKELHPFLECDLNRPGWARSYKTDSLNRDSLLILEYTALEPCLRVRRLEIIQKHGVVVRINAECAQGNTWFSARQSLTFENGKGYDIRGCQKVILADSSTYRINVQIVIP